MPLLKIYMRRSANVVADGEPTLTWYCFPNFINKLAKKKIKVEGRGSWVEGRGLWVEGQGGWGGFRDIPKLLYVLRMLTATTYPTCRSVLLHSLNNCRFGLQSWHLQVCHSRWCADIITVTTWFWATNKISPMEKQHRVFFKRNNIHFTL